MDAVERLRQLIEEQGHARCLDVPTDREAAILALVRAIDQLPKAAHPTDTLDLVTGRRLVNPGGSGALHLVFSCTDPVEIGSGDAAELDEWARTFVNDCGHLTEAEIVLEHVDSGRMRLAGQSEETLSAWLTSKRMPAAWRERIDIDWWAEQLRERLAPEMERLLASHPGCDAPSETRDVYYRRLADLHLEAMAYQLGLPDKATVGGCSIGTYRDVLRLLIAWTLRDSKTEGSAAARSEWELVQAVAAELDLDSSVVETALDALTLDELPSAYHAVPPGVAAPPIVRIAPDRVILSRFGLLTEPLFFLARELRRRDPETYNNTAALREDVFRQNLYNLFSDKRFLTSPGRIELRREGGDLRTDIDAAIFDRKTGTLGTFELKSQDPFARSALELGRQIDNLLYANRQVSGVLAWIQRHGGDALLSRVDQRAAKQFRVQKVFPFVLGRYLVPEAESGTPPDPRAAWSTWPQLLRLLDGQPVTALGGNPLATLHARLCGGAAAAEGLIGIPARSIEIGDTRLKAYPSQAAYRAASG